MLNRCFICKKLMLFKTYGVIKYHALDHKGRYKEYKGYLCKDHSDMFDEAARIFDEDDEKYNEI